MTFDLDDTLYHNWPYLVEAERGLLNYIADRYPGSSHLNNDDWQQFKRQALRDDPTLFSDMGELRRTVLKAGLQQGGYTGSALKKAVVNTEQIGIDKYFQTVLKASKDSPMKPHAHMFDKAAALLAEPRQKILHVGDNLVKDVWGASIAGFSTAWHACDRKMDIRSEPVKVLPNVEIQELEELTHLL